MDTKDFKSEFIKALKKSPSANIEDIAERLGVSPLTLHTWLFIDRDFKCRVQSYLDNLEGRHGS